MWQGLAEFFASEGHEVTIFARAHAEQPRTEMVAGVNYFRHAGFSQSRNVVADLIKDLGNALRITPHLPAADILVINDFWLPVLARWLRRDVGKLVINVNRFPKRQFILYSGVARFVAASSTIAEVLIAQRPAIARRVRVLPNPTDTRLFSPSSHARLKSERKTVLYVGRIHPEKGLELLIDAVALISEDCPNIKLRIVGPVKENEGGGGPRYSRRLKSKAQHLDVEFLDPIFDPTRLVEIYRQADLFCYPSLAETGESFGLAPLEAMATGLVPIVSDLGCFRDFIVEGQTGYYFDHRGPDAAVRLSRVLRRAMADDGQISRMSVEGVRMAGVFSYERVGRLYLEDFAELIARKEYRSATKAHTAEAKLAAISKPDLPS
jgi:glycosyltransferase involved in cell wall biosynthesis